MSVEETLKDRGNKYGNWEDHAQITQCFKNFTRQILAKQQKEVHPAAMEALDMIFLKIGRIVNGDPSYVDSWVDIAGYATLEVHRLSGHQSPERGPVKLRSV